jgi:hypothetical protein
MEFAISVFVGEQIKQGLLFAFVSMKVPLISSPPVDTINFLTASSHTKSIDIFSTLFPLKKSAAPLVERFLNTVRTAAI